MMNEWVVDNEEWILIGFSVTILLLVLGFFLRKTGSAMNQHSEKYLVNKQVVDDVKIQRQASGDNCTNIQAAGDVHVHNHVSQKLLQTTIERLEDPRLKAHEHIITLIENGDVEAAQANIDELVDSILIKCSSGLVDLAILQNLISSNKSKRLFEKAREMDPENPNIMNVFALSLMDEGRVGEAETCFKKAIELSSEASIIEKVNGNLGILYKNTGRYLLAIESLKCAKEMASQIGHHEGEVKHINNLGACYHNINKLNDAETELNLALSKIKIMLDSESNKKELKSIQASILTNLAITFKNKFRENQDGIDLEKASSFLERAIDIEESLGNESMLGRHYGNIAEIYRLQENKDQHNKYVFKCYNIFERTGSSKDKLTSRMNVGLYYAQYFDYKEALKKYDELLSDENLLKFPKLNVQTLINSAVVHLKVNDESQYRSLLKRAVEIAKDHALEYELNYLKSFSV